MTLWAPLLPALLGVVWLLGWPLLSEGFVGAAQGARLLVMVLALAGSGWLWWSAEPVVQGLVLVGVGVVLLLGAWRHLAAVVGRPSRDSDPAVLGRITPLPTAVWTATFVIVLALATWLTLEMVAELVDFGGLPWNS